MGITIDQVLALAGRLDDSQGFDTARERFRRFILEYVDDVERARLLIEQCQHAPSEQHQRALQDLVALLGRPLGFEVTFGAYAPAGEAVASAGHWLSRARLFVAIELRTSGAAAAGVDGLISTVETLAPSFADTSVRAAGLTVLTSTVGRHKVDEALNAARPSFPVGVIALRTLVAMAGKVSSGAMTHDHVIRLIEGNIPGDFIVDVLEQSTAAPSALRREPAQAPAPVPVSAPAAHANGEAAFWIATIGPDHATRPEEFLELVVARRHVLGIVDIGPLRAAAVPGDGVCFYVAGKGVVGHARVAPPAGGSDGLRDAHRFRQVIHLTDVTLHLDVPIPLDPETELRMRTAGLVTSRHAPTLVGISRDSFAAFTAPRPRLSAG